LLVNENQAVNQTRSKTQNQIHYVVYRYKHHSPHSGYSRLAEYGSKINHAEVIHLEKPLPKWLIRERIYWFLAKGTPGYTRESMAAELTVARRMLREKDAIFHFLYGETIYHYAGLLHHHRGNRLVATFHAPVVGLEKRVQINWHLKQLSGIVCLGTSQMEYMSNIVGPDRVHLSSLGIDTEYYTPSKPFEERDPDLCLFVGDNYRDFPTLRGVIELVSYKRPQTKFVGVLPERCHGLIGTHPNLELYTGIPEEDLLELYRTASLMVMPFDEAVANNAVLEGIACGLPLVVTDVGSTCDYVTSACATLMPLHDSRKMAETVLELLESPEDLDRMSQAAVVQARKFSWPKVVAQLNSIYAYID
jgi:glycosyltransferase involved in cell wall biosynthesis